MPVTVIVTAEHASNTIPPALANLGLLQDILTSHVAWDPGAREVATELANALGAQLFLGEHSRLVADLNRSPGSAEVVPEVAFGVIVPGNAKLSPAERAAREEMYHRPYWTKVESAVRAAAVPVLHVSMHSFTESLHGKKRDVDLGVLLDPDRPLEGIASEFFLKAMRAFGFDARENEPYDGRSDGLTTALRGRLPATDYAGVEIEISQRLIGDLDRVAAAVIDAVRSLALP